jgi:hypothetical protein
MKKPVVVAFCVLVAMTGAGLAAEPLQPEEGSVAEAGEANAAPDTPEAKEEDRIDSSTAASEADGEDAPPAKEYRHRPGACPEGPPCKGE